MLVIRVISDFVIIWAIACMHACCLAKLSIHTACRVQWVGVINFGTDRVRVLEKTSGSGMEYGSGWGIGTAFFINRVFSGIENLDWAFFGYIPDKVFLLGSTRVQAALGRLTPVHPRDPIK